VGNRAAGHPNGRVEEGLRVIPSDMITDMSMSVTFQQHWDVPEQRDVPGLGC